MSPAVVRYLSSGGNRQSAAADVSINSGAVAFGADHNIAIWHPFSHSGTGIQLLLQGHTDTVTAVRYFKTSQDDEEHLISGSANGELRLWLSTSSESTSGWTSGPGFKGHDGSVITISFLNSSFYFATGGADAIVRLWKIRDLEAECVHTIKLTPRYIPLSLVLETFDIRFPSDGLFLIVGGTKNVIQVYALTQLRGQPHHELQANLTGHEGWIRSLALWSSVSDTCTGREGDLLLASGSNDKYIRLWRIQEGKAQPGQGTSPGECSISLFEHALTSKVQMISSGERKYSITFEALLLGHEDWIYSVAWHPFGKQQLLSSSADGSLALWEPDPESGIWLTASRLGEISGQKGATTATGSAGGFWTGVWLQKENKLALASLGRTGSWRVWESKNNGHLWTQTWGVSGHTSSVNGLTWSPDGAYLLSTGSDQTTRLHAEWTGDRSWGWHEMTRPQIHGYDLNCITSLSSRQFVSGADEKLLRVFDQPKEVAQLLKRLCKIEPERLISMPEVASIPVLGLSNKASGDREAAEDGTDNPTALQSQLLDEISGPPTEDLLARHTLWPEREKLYGHGYEISEAAANPELGILATACKASSFDHAVIRLYDTNTWFEIKPPLSSHSLTVTRLAFSRAPLHYLLSVGRDRQWTVFKQDPDSKQWEISQSNGKAHSRMILDCTWSPATNPLFFATASRDKSVKIWSASYKNGTEHFELQHTLKFANAVTATCMTCNSDESITLLAVGEEDGRISIQVLDTKTSQINVVKSVEVERSLCPSRGINRLAWRPRFAGYLPATVYQLAVASTDGSVRILQFDQEDIWEQITV